MRRALGIVVDFLGDHLKDKMLTEFNTLDKLLSRRSGSSYPVSNNPSYSTRVCPKCALKIWNVVEPPCFLKANLNSVLAHVKQLPMTVTLNNVGSVNRNLQRSEKLRLLLQNQRVKRLY